MWMGNTLIPMTLVWNCSSNNLNNNSSNKCSRGKWIFNKGLTIIIVKTIPPMRISSKIKIPTWTCLPIQSIQMEISQIIVIVSAIWTTTTTIIWHHNSSSNFNNNSSNSKGNNNNNSKEWTTRTSFRFLTIPRIKGAW